MILSLGLRSSPKYVREIWKCSFTSTVEPNIHHYQSPTKTHLFENASFRYLKYFKAIIAPANGKHLENEAFRKRWRHRDHVISVNFSFNTFAISISSIIEGLNGVNRQMAKKINRQPSKTEYFCHQPSNERAKISRQISFLIFFNNFVLFFTFLIFFYFFYTTFFKQFLKYFFKVFFNFLNFFSNILNFFLLNNCFKI